MQAVQHKITPPSKQISFNKNLKSNDGLLGNHIAERRQISYEEASGLIKSFVNRSIEGLNKGDKIKIEKVGTLYLDPEQNIQFSPEEKTNFLLDSFGLTSLRVQPVVREGSAKKVEENIKKVIPLIQEKKKKRYYWPAAAILFCAVASAFYVNEKFSIINAGDVQYSAFGWNSSEESTYKVRNSNFKLNSFSSVEGDELTFEEAIVPYITPEKEPTQLYVDNRKEESAVKIDNTEVVVNETREDLKFHVMGGCFSSLANAEGLVNKLKAQGYNASLLGKYKNLYAVSFGSFTRREEAAQLLSTVKDSENSAAWLLVKSF